MKPRTWLALLLIAIPLDARAAGLDFASYQGGSAEDTCRDVAFDAAGNLYAVGGTKSPNFATTDGSILNRGANGAGAGPHDVWIAKFDPTGRLIWSKLIGGNGYDRADAVEVNATGVYVAGRAGVGFPTTPGALQTAFAGDASPEAFYGPQDGFVARLNHDGVVQWATYVGGPGLNIIRDMDIDATGAVYAGITGDGPSPHVTAGAFDTSPGSGKNATIVKIAPNGSSAVWGTYLGGTGDDGINPSVRVDPANGTVYRHDVVQ